MGLKDRDWKSHYNSRINNISTEFFIPALSESTVYRRIAGFFSSTNIALCARGLKELIGNYGRMQLIVLPILTQNDLKAINEEVTTLDKVIEKSLTTQLDHIQNEFEKDHIGALKFLLKEGFLEIRLEIPKDDTGKPLDKDAIIKSTITPEKRGIFQDRERTVLSFRGQIDESKESWEKGIYQITVYVDWIEGQRNHVLDDIKIFEEKWNSSDTITLPESVKNKLIMTAPEKDQIDLDKYNYPSWAILPNNKLLWPHQIRSINAWIKNDYKGIFTMATGSGKTITALAAVNLAPKNKMVLIIAYGKSLVTQWKNEIISYRPESDIIICDSSYNWKEIISGKLIPYLKGINYPNPSKRLYIIATPQTASMKIFQDCFKNIDGQSLQFVADEVHHLGAEEFSKVFLLNSSRRLGLSATYRRDWDETGTQIILDYFGKALEEAKYGLSDAIKEGRLSQYKYYPYFAYLDDLEFEDYVKISLKIKHAFSFLGINEDSINLPVLPKSLETLLIKRAKIIKKCRDKIRVFTDIIETRPKKPFIVFADDGEQADQLRNAYVSKYREINKSGSLELVNDSIMLFSGKLNGWQRRKMITEAKQRSIPMIGMYCLDEGIDIPELQSAIIVSSSRSKRQYIQRRGRILRIGKKGKIAELYDIIVFAKYDPEPIRNEIASQIISKEKERMEELCKDSQNKFTAELKIYNEIKEAGFEYIV